jgi:hypothetical protein
LPPSLQARLEAAISSPGGMFSSAGYQGSAPAMLAQVSPVLAGYAQTAAALTAATIAPSITQVSNVTNNIDASTRYTDASLHQQLTNIGGTLTNEITSASGDGAVAAGPDAHVTAATGAGSAAIGENATVEGGVFTGPINDATVIGRDANDANISGHDKIVGSGNMTDADGTGANVGGTNVGSTSEVANKDGILSGGGSVNAGSPGAAAASGGSQAATGGGAPGAEGGSVDGGGNTLQVGGTNVAAVGSEGVNTAGGGDANQINQEQPQIGFGTGAGGEPGAGVGTEGTQIASIAPEGGGPVYFDQTSSDPGAQAPYEDGGMSQPVDTGVSDQPAGTEHTDPLG